MKVFEAAKKKLALVPLAAGAALVAFPSLAFADEGAQPEAAQGGGGVELLVPNPLEFVPMLIGFILLWIILAKFAWPVITDMLDKRVTTIRDSLEKAESAKIESERLLEEHKTQLEDAKKQAAQIVADAKAAGEAVKADIVAAAQVEAQAAISKATAAIEAEKKAAIAQLQSSVADLSVSVAGRLIGQDLSDADHRRVIERYLAEAGSLNAN
ncbi:MAG: F0F1 ATP synthase subunit B [Coriobacteriales bacterium]|nr:F0F1 ATP synthase subunit B [Coriobacteriales bacterium]